MLGLPLGIAAGAAVWRNVADDLGVDSSLVFAPLLLLLVPAALAVAVSWRRWDLPVAPGGCRSQRCSTGSSARQASSCFTSVLGATAR